MNKIRVLKNILWRRQPPKDFLDSPFKIFFCRRKRRNIFYTSPKRLTIWRHQPPNDRSVVIIQPHIQVNKKPVSAMQKRVFCLPELLSVSTFSSWRIHFYISGACKSEFHPTIHQIGISWDQVFFRSFPLQDQTAPSNIMYANQVVNYRL